MLNSKLLLFPQVAPPKETIYLSKESSPSEKNLVYYRNTVSTVGYAKKMMMFYSGHQSQRGMVDIREIRPETIYGMPHVSPDIGVWFHPINLATYYPSLNRPYPSLNRPYPSLNRPKPILSDEILIVPLRDISHENAKKEITNYIQHAGGRKVYISELAEELRLDIELIMEVMEELKTETRG